MTINQARSILNFIIRLKKKSMKNDDVVWELANNFNVETGEEAWDSGKEEKDEH